MKYKEKYNCEIKKPSVFDVLYSFESVIKLNLQNKRIDKPCYQIYSSSVDMSHCVYYTLGLLSLLIHD